MPKKKVLMRLDKFLKVSHILKRRTVANTACSDGVVLVNGKEAKPSLQLKLGDVITVQFASGNARFEVIGLNEKARKAEEFYRVVPQ